MSEKLNSVFSRENSTAAIKKYSALLLLGSRAWTWWRFIQSIKMCGSIRNLKITLEKLTYPDPLFSLGSAHRNFSVNESRSTLSLYKISPTSQAEKRGWTFLNRIICSYIWFMWQTLCVLQSFLFGSVHVNCISQFQNCLRAVGNLTQNYARSGIWLSCQNAGKCRKQKDFVILSFKMCTGSLLLYSLCC